MKAAVRNAPGKLAGGKVLGMEAKVAVVGNLGFRVDPAGVVGAGCDAVFAADTAVRIHRDDVGFRIVVAGAVGQTFTQGESTHCWQETRM